MASDALPMPSYYQCMIDIYSTAVSQYNDVHTDNSHVLDLIRNISLYSKISKREIFWSIFIAVMLTLVRYILTEKVLAVSNSETDI